MRTCSPSFCEIQTRTGAPSPAIARTEIPVDDDGITDQIESAINRNTSQPLRSSLVEFEEDRKLVVPGEFFEVRVDARLGHPPQS